MPMNQPCGICEWMKEGVQWPSLDIKVHIRRVIIAYTLESWPSLANTAPDHSRGFVLNEAILLINLQPHWF